MPGSAGAYRKLIMGLDESQSASRDAMSNAESMDWFIDFVRQRRAMRPATQ
jgi:hypothetical protein